MKKIEIVITTPTQAVDTFKETWRRAAAGEAVTPTLGFGSPAELYSAITDKRLELLRYVAQHEDEALNIHQLAQALGRDYKNVHVDVKALEALGAKRILINIVQSLDGTLDENELVAERVAQGLAEGGKLTIGLALDEALGDSVNPVTMHALCCVQKAT